ncbi:MAG: hypothetical protein AB7S38_09990 [Vulcanimicrobiota bacterium]
MLFLVACSRPPALSERYQALVKAGQPQQILSEYSRPDLVRQAPVLFPYHVDFGKLHLYSDEPFPPERGAAILAEVKRRLAASPLYHPEDTHSAFVCNERWREEYYLNGAGKLAGLNYFPTANHVFLGPARIPDDALLSPAGNPIASPRTLTYYLTHEFTHTLVGMAVAERTSPTPVWLREGYPDCVALGPNYTHAQALAAYHQRDPRVKATMAEDYLRYGVMVAYLLEHGHTIQDLLADPPDPARVAGQAGL